jgi:hypothetical protein
MREGIFDHYGNYANNKSSGGAEGQGVEGGMGARGRGRVVWGGGGGLTVSVIDSGI